MWCCYCCSGNSRVALVLLFFYLPDIEIFHVWEVSHKLILFGREQQKCFLRNEGEKHLLENERGENTYIKIFGYIKAV